MAPLKVEQYVVGPVQTNCYFAVNDETKEMILIDPGGKCGSADTDHRGRKVKSCCNFIDTWTF